MAKAEKMGGAMVIVFNNLESTEQVGYLLGQAALPGDVLCLDGDLGAGKTTLTQAIARGLGVPEEYYVTSPSFAVLQEYPGRIPLYHMDFYRLRDSNDVLDLGFEDYFYGFGLTVIEWADRARDILPEAHLALRLEGHGQDRRLVTLSGQGPYFARILSLIRAMHP